MGSGISTKYEKTYFYKLKEDRPYPKTEGSLAVDIMLSIGDFLKKIHFIQR